MKTCNDCVDKKICNKPCNWLKKELSKVTVKKEFLNFTELGILEKEIAQLEDDFQ